MQALRPDKHKSARDNSDKLSIPQAPADHAKHTGSSDVGLPSDESLLDQLKCEEAHLKLTGGRLQDAATREHHLGPMEAEDDTVSLSAHESPA